MRSAASESARGGATSVRASAATIPLSGYRRVALTLRSLLLFAVDARAVVGDEQPAVRALEADVAVRFSGQELGLERLAAMGALELIGAVRSRSVSHGPRIARADECPSLLPCLLSVARHSSPCSRRFSCWGSSSSRESTR